MRLKPFRAAHGAADHWGLATKACLDALGGIGDADTIGLIYVTQAFAGDLASIVTFLRETTPLRAWIGGVGFGIYAPGTEQHEGGGVAMMVGHLPEDGFRLFEHDAGALPDDIRAWLSHAITPVALVHAAPNSDALAALASVAAESGGFLVGGLTATTSEDRVAGQVSTAPLSGALFRPPVRVMVGLTQGCTPIGRSHQVTEAVDNVLMTIDGRPALQVLREEAGEIIARDLRRAAGYIHAALPVEGSDRGDYVVRSLTGIDPERGWLALGGQLVAGERMLFVCRDANAAQRDLRRTVAELHERVTQGGGTVLGGVYISCVARGPHMFGAAGQELALIEERFAGLPIVGFSANGEICRDQLYTYTGVLAIFIGDAQ